MRIVSNLLELAGLGAITVALGLVWLPLGVLFGGASLLVIGIAIGPRR